MRPKICPKCGSDDIGELGNAEGEIFRHAGCQYTDEEYEAAGGRYYCISCGWTEPLNVRSPSLEPSYYEPGFCDCGCGTCDVCNPGWEDENWYADLYQDDVFGLWE